MADRTPEFVNRVHSAEGLYLTLCEVLLEVSAATGAALWRALRENLRTRFHGMAGVPELLHIVFRAAPGPEVLALRDEAASILFCNTDADLLELVIAAQANGQDAWLESFIAVDAASDALWRRKRAIAMDAFRRSPDLQKLEWSEGKKTSSWGALTDHMRTWSNRSAFARYWWQKFVAAGDSDEAFAAWVVFLSCADRRAHIWMAQHGPDANQDPELVRLRAVHLELAEHVLTKHLKEPEEKNPGLSVHLFGQDAPSKWLMLDGVRH
jgi:hypothetical protein